MGHKLAIFCFLTLCVFSSALILPMKNAQGTLDVDSIVNHVTLMEQTITSLQTQMQTTDSKLKSAENEISSLRSDLKTANDELNVLKGQHQNGNSAGNSNITPELTKIKTDVAVLKTNLATLQNTAGSGNLNKDVTTNANDIQSLSKQLKSVVDSVKHTEHDLNSTKVQLSSLQPQIVDTVTVLTGATHNIQDNQKKIQNLEKQLNDYATAISAVTSSVQNLESRVPPLERKIIEVSQNEQLNKHDLSLALSSAQSTSAAVTSVQNQCAAVNASLVQLRHDIDAMKHPTGPTEQCLDVDSRCSSYEANKCNHPTYMDWLRKYCQKLCGTCSANGVTSSSLSTSCVDRLTNCPTYGQNACGGTYTEWAMTNCKKTCHFC